MDGRRERDDQENGMEKHKRDGRSETKTGGVMTSSGVI